LGAPIFFLSMTEWSDAEADKIGEMAKAEAAYFRLREALKRLQADLAGSPARALRLKGYILKRQYALAALERHARLVIDEFAFIDGQHVTQPDPAMLNAFYTNPSEAVAARYCWALLQHREEAEPIGRIIAATDSEYDMFVAKQAAAVPTPSAKGERGKLNIIEALHAKRADRMAYRVAALRRLTLIQRYIHSLWDAVDNLDTETVQAIEAAEDAAEELRRVRLAQVVARSKPS
jgi:hypothetical protein